MPSDVHAISRAISGGPQPLSSAPLGAFGVTLPVSQADLGNAALKVGGSVFSGMKALGGMAFNALQARGSSNNDKPSQGVESKNLQVAVSRSAPSAMSASDISVEPDAIASRGRLVSARQPLAAEVDTKSRTDPISRIPSDGGAASSADAFVTVCDLAPLLLQAEKPRKTRPETLVHFVALHDQSVSALQFSADGTTLMIARRDGTIVKTFKVQTIPKAVRLAHDDASSTWAEVRRAEPTLVYDLKRGRTSGVVENMKAAQDGRWAAIGTRARTIHVFAVNPYGGGSDIRSHTEGQIRNPAELVHYLRILPMYTR
jgi:hypothetical protein